MVLRQKAVRSEMGYMASGAWRWGDRHPQGGRRTDCEEDRNDWDGRDWMDGRKSRAGTAYGKTVLPWAGF